MSKRALLWSLGVVAFAFTFLGAVNVAQTQDVFGSPFEVCHGLWNPIHWFSRLCSDSLPERFGVLAIGLAVLLPCVYFAEKGGNPALTGGHDVRYDAKNNSWTCGESGCGWSGISRGGARAHRISTGATVATSVPTSSSSGSSAPSAPVQLQPPALSSAPADRQPEFKTCPDCAEEIRFAARKCRFCGYVFDSSEGRS
jgi:hypothetical protein